MLDQADASHDDLLCHSDRDLVQFLGIISRIRRNRIDGLIQQVSLRRADLTQGPVGITDKIVAGEGTGCVCRIRGHQVIALVQTVHCPGQAGVSLCISGLPIRLGHLHPEFLQDIGEAALCNLIPLDGRRL